jgi:hypothetical protein
MMEENVGDKVVNNQMIDSWQQCDRDRSTDEFGLVLVVE